MRPVPSSIATRLKSAAVPIAERGLDQTKIEDIAAAATIPKATLYYYFAGKEEILSFLLTDLLTEVAGAVAVACDAPGTARDRLVGVVTALGRGRIEVAPHALRFTLAGHHRHRMDLRDEPLPEGTSRW